MEEAAAEDGDVKPLTNGIDKEEVCTVLISTDEQWLDSKNDSVDLSFCKIPAKRLALHSWAVGSQQPRRWGLHYLGNCRLNEKTFVLVALRVQMFFREKAVWAGLPSPTAKKSTVPEETGMLTLLFAFTPRFFFWFIGATWFNLKLLFCHRMPCPPTWR